MSGWWYLAGASFVISAAFWLRVSALLSATNPSIRLPWIRLPAHRPRGIGTLLFLAVASLTLGVNFVINIAHDTQMANALWAIPAVTAVLVVGVVMPHRRHNRRIRERPRKRGPSPS